MGAQRGRTVRRDVGRTGELDTAYIYPLQIRLPSTCLSTKRVKRELVLQRNISHRHLRCGPQLG